MNVSAASRRNFLRVSNVVPFAAALGISANGLAARGLKVLVTGGHPGDPECGCAGTIARYSAMGAEVTLLYLNRGEGYCGSAALPQCGEIRTREAERACQILNARPVFAGEVDGQAVVDGPHYDQVAKLIDAQSPDVLLAQWPIDQHRDHRALSNLVLDAWLKGGKKAGFYYYEVADDTMMFSPTEFVDISAPEVEKQRRAACFAHASQQPEKWYAAQTFLTRGHGVQIGCAQAEGFVRHWQTKPASLP